MLREVRLYGSLGDEFGGCFKLDVASPAEAVRALECAFPGRFLSTIREGSYRVSVGSHDIDHVQLCMMSGNQPISITPAIAGSGGGGSSMIIIGVLMVAFAVVTMGAGAAIDAGLAAGEGMDAAGVAASAMAGATSAGVGVAGFTVSAASIGMMGLGLMLSGLASVMSKGTKTNSTGGSLSSYLFTGPANGSQQGVPVPLVFGEFQVGSLVASVNVSLTAGNTGYNTSTVSGTNEIAIQG